MPHADGVEWESVGDVCDFDAGVECAGGVYGCGGVAAIFLCGSADAPEQHFIY